MNVQLLIDEIVRQTTVLIAQLSTAAGLRAPLSQVADQVFLELSKELGAQGVRRHVVADMFGMALRSYQMKVRRLNETAEKPAGSLWQDLYADLSGGSATRTELERRHRPHTPKRIAAALADMVQSGVAYSSGRGAEMLFGLTSDADRQRLSATDKRRVQRDLCWYLVASGSAKSRADLVAQLRMDRPSVEEIIDELIAGEHVAETEGSLGAKRFEVAVGAEQGWEASVFDHFRAVATAIAAKVNRPVAADDDRIGGGTRSFLVHPAHPHAEEVYELLSETRRRTRELWRRVSDHNQHSPPPENANRVTFYFGQNVVNGCEEEEVVADDEDATHDTDEVEE